MSGEIGHVTDAGKRLSTFERMIVVREVGNLTEELEPDELNTERGFALHLAGHSVVEELLFGTVSQDLNVGAPCPYCGKLPPEAAE